MLKLLLVVASRNLVMASHQFPMGMARLILERPVLPYHRDPPFVRASLFQSFNIYAQFANGQQQIVFAIMDLPNGPISPFEPFSPAGPT